jgi:endonuclease G
MKKLILLLFLPLSLFSQKRDSVKVQNSIFTIIYSEKLEQPRRIDYKVQCPNGKASRAGMDFYTVDSIHTSDHLDYVNNVYDKGHLAPAADFNCSREMLLLTFSYLNCVLQNQYLNRGVWRLLEAEERKLAEKESVQVTIEILFDSKPEVLPTGASIPRGFRKTVFLPAKKKGYVYYFPNQKPEKKTFSEYLESSF